MPAETPSPDRDRPAPRPEEPRRARRYGYLVGWIAVTTGTIVASSLALQAALKADRDQRPVSAPQQALHLSPSDAPSTASPSPTPSPTASPTASGAPSASVFGGPPFKGRPRPGPPFTGPPDGGPPPGWRRGGPPRPKVTISSPGERAKVRGAEGVLLTGTATGLGGLTLHIFDLADNGSYYPGSLTPVTVHGGQWSFRKRPIGRGAADVGRTFIMIAALGNGDCRAALRTAPVNHEGDHAFPALPAGCREMDSVRVVKDAP